MILNKYFLVSFFNNFKNLKTVWNVGIIYLENLFKIRNFFIYVKNRVIFVVLKPHENIGVNHVFFKHKNW